jgi:hypothetical protein
MPPLIIPTARAKGAAANGVNPAAVNAIIAPCVLPIDERAAVPMTAVIFAQVLKMVRQDFMPWL